MVTQQIGRIIIELPLPGKCRSILNSLSMFLCFVNYPTLTTDQRIQAALMQNLFENVHSVREEEATWSGRLPCAFF